MNPITEKTVKLAYTVDRYMGGRVAVLKNLDLVGTLKESETTQLSKFLTDNKIEHETNGKGLVWLPGVHASVRELFIKNMKEDKKIIEKETV